MKIRNFWLNRAEFSCRSVEFHKRVAREVCQNFSGIFLLFLSQSKVLDGIFKKAF